MKTFLFFSDFIIPFTMFYIVIYGFFNKIDVYESFLKGVKEGFRIVVKIAPTMVALLVSVGVLRASGAMEAISRMMQPVGEFFHMPSALLPVFLVRIFSSSAAISFVLDIFKEYGPDSSLGMMTSIMMSCTETVIYTVTIYYMSIHVKKTRWTIPGALFTSVVGAAASIILTEKMMGI